MVMTRDRHADLALLEDGALAPLVGMPGHLVAVTFRGARVCVLAAHDRAAQHSRTVAPGPVTDPLHLELLSGAGEAPGWLRPVVLHAVIEARSDPLLAVQRASRWASYAARLALVAEARLTDQVLLDAQLRGVWVVTVDKNHQLRVAVTGQPGPADGSMRGLAHRLLDELIWAELRRSPAAVATAPTPAATR
jgi:hypothetical protein